MERPLLEALFGSREVSQPGASAFLSAECGVLRRAEAAEVPRVVRPGAERMGPVVLGKGKSQEANGKRT